MIRTCTRCHEAKPLTEFPMNRSSSGKLVPHSRCRACRREQCRAHSKTLEGKQGKRRRVLRSQFGLSIADYQAMYAMQGGCCAICQRPEVFVSRAGVALRLSVDHDHKTGRVRGLLCAGCNAGLGYFKENPAALLVAIDYLATNNRLNELLGQAAKAEAAETAAKS